MSLSFRRRSPPQDRNPSISPSPTSPSAALAAHSARGPVGAIDLAHIEAIAVDFQVTAGGSFSLDAFQTFQPAAVPETGTSLALLALSIAVSAGSARLQSNS